MFEPLKRYIEGKCAIEYSKNTDERAYLLRDNDIESIDYYLTSPYEFGSELHGRVKLGAKVTLKNGEKYGNIIQIPFHTLVKLVDQYKLSKGN
jgi:hypothetical protein